MNKRFAVAALLLVLTFTLGCNSGPRTMRVWGEATFDGTPIEQGEIVFFPIEPTRGPSVGGPIENGHYDIDAASGPQSGGTYRVEITGLRKGKKYTPSVAGDGPIVEPMVNFVPDIYNRKTTLQVQISESADANQHDFKLAATKK